MDATLLVAYAIRIIVLIVIIGVVVMAVKKVLRLLRRSGEKGVALGQTVGSAVGKLKRRGKDDAIAADRPVPVAEAVSGASSRSSAPTPPAPPTGQLDFLRETPAASDAIAGAGGLAMGQPPVSPLAGAPAALSPLAGALAGVAQEASQPAGQEAPKDSPGKPGGGLLDIFKSTESEDFQLTGLLKNLEDVDVNHLVEESAELAKLLRGSR